MYRLGAFVTLLNNKIHGEGEHEMRLSSGLMGMVVRNTSERSGNHGYVVDFGPEGQWNCLHSELKSESPDAEDEGSGDYGDGAEDRPVRMEINDNEDDEDNDRDEDDEDEDTSDDGDGGETVGIHLGDAHVEELHTRSFTFDEIFPAPHNKEKPMVDFEADLARMMAEQERKGK